MQRRARGAQDRALLLTAGGGTQQAQQAASETQVGDADPHLQQLVVNAGGYVAAAAELLAAPGAAQGEGRGGAAAQPAAVDDAVRAARGDAVSLNARGRLAESATMLQKGAQN